MTRFTYEDWARPLLLPHEAEYILPPDTDDGGDYQVIGMTLTGPDPIRAEVLRLVFLDRNGTPMLDMLFRPVEAKEWPEAEALTGIGPAAVAGCEHMFRCVPDIAMTLRCCNHIVGYNAYFQLAALFRRGVTWRASVTDVMVEAARMLPLCGYESRKGFPSLRQCAEYFGRGEYMPKHDAYEDALATLECYRAMRGHQRDIEEWRERT